MRVQNIYPHRKIDGGMAITFQVVDDDGDPIICVYKIDLPEAAWLAQKFISMVYEDVSK